MREICHITIKLSQVKKAVIIVTANVYVYIFLYISINRFLLSRLYGAFTALVALICLGKDK